MPARRVRAQSKWIKKKKGGGRGREGGRSMIAGTEGEGKHRHGGNIEQQEG